MCCAIITQALPKVGTMSDRPSQEVFKGLTTNRHYLIAQDSKMRKPTLRPLNQNDFSLEILEDLGMQYSTSKSKSKKRHIIAKCPECKKGYRVVAPNVKNGKSTKCNNCYIRKGNPTHKMTRTRIYYVWSSMKKRCINENDKSFSSYGGRGIKVCDEWMEDFSHFYEWAKNNGHQENLTIDRIDNDKGYSPKNCRWTTQSVQSRNTRRIMSTNTSGYRGVSLQRYSNKWVSHIGVNKKLIYLGTYDTKKDAAMAYDRYVIKNNLEHTRNFK